MLYLASEVDNEYIYHGFYDNGIYRCVRLEKTNAMIFYITENDIITYMVMSILMWIIMIYIILFQKK
jgi:hypothetical protein